MSNYLLNLKLFLLGFWKLGALNYKPGWTPIKFLPLYLFDYGFCVLVMAGPVVSVSWYVGEYWNVPGSHFALAGDPLWESVRSPPWVRIVVPALWASLLWVAV
jgi:hypothetical protein